MLANYGYKDASGDFFITLDTDKCDGCGRCVEVCPKNIFIIQEDDYDKPVAMVRAEFSKNLSYQCYGYSVCSSRFPSDCHKACERDALEHSW